MSYNIRWDNLQLPNSYNLDVTKRIDLNSEGEKVFRFYTYDKSTSLQTTNNLFLGNNKKTYRLI